LKDQMIRSIVTIAAVCAIAMCACCRQATDSKVATTAGLSKKAATISLAGQWSFKLDPKDAGQQEKWYAGKLPDSIKLPGSTTENGYGDEPSVDTKWTGQIVDKSWFTEDKYEKYRQPGNINITSGPPGTRSRSKSRKAGAAKESSCCWNDVTGRQKSGWTGPPPACRTVFARLRFTI